jgi:hypothetical protein
MTTTTETYRHDGLDIVAPRTYWSALGYSVFTTGNVGTGPHNGEELLILGIAATGAHDEKAVAWAIAEKQRRIEKQTESTALAREADGLKALAESIRQNSNEEFLTKLFGRLTDKTRYAIKAQLRDRPL